MYKLYSNKILVTLQNTILQSWCSSFFWNTVRVQERMLEKWCSCRRELDSSGFLRGTLTQFFNSHCFFHNSFLRPIFYKRFHVPPGWVGPVPIWGVEKETMGQHSCLNWHTEVWSVGSLSVCLMGWVPLRSQHCQVMCNSFLAMLLLYLESIIDFSKNC